MKKLSIIILLGLLSIPAFAQSPQWGAKFGLNIANVSKLDGNVKPSIYFGALAEFKINDIIGIQPEVMYSRQGTKYSESIEGTSIKVWERFNYLNIPVLAKLYLIENLSFELGPQFGILLNAKKKVKVGGRVSKEKIKDLKNFDVAMGIGLSYKFFSNYEVSARYNVGLTKIHSYTKAKNNVFQLGIGYRFGRY